VYGPPIPAEFQLLGQLEVVDGGSRLSLRAAKPRALLAILLVHAGEPVSSDRLIDDLWAGRPPATAPKILQTYVSQLRRVLGNGSIVTRPAGYELEVEPKCLDVHRFEQLVIEARAADPAVAADRLRQALALWRGPPLADFAHQPWARSEIGRLEELRLDALQDRIDADLALGCATELVPELETLVAEYPVRERLRGQLMLALYRSGRQADALAAYRAARRTLVEKLAIEPGPELRRLERAILDQDPDLDLRAVEPTATVRNATSTLGTRTSSFVGRKQQLREISALLGRSEVRLLTLTGPAGTGKTRLALEATAQGGLSRETVFVEIAPVVDPRLVAATIAATLGLSETSQQRATEAVISYLRGRRMLLLLDNLEQVLEAAPVLAELLHGAPDVQLLVTSRAPLGLAEEHVYEVPPLQVVAPSAQIDLGRLRRTEAIRLFVDRGRVARSDFALSEENADAVAELCRRLDGLPLALELAAARIKLLAPRTILERLDGRLELLKAAPGAGVPARHRTLGNAIEWSYELLEVEEQTLFTSLAVFVGGFTLAGAEAVAGEVDIDVVDGIESLLTKSLLRAERMAVGEPRFGMLETIREYGLERLAERGDAEAVRRRHAEFYLRLAEEAEPALLGPDQIRWARKLDGERDNLRAALTWAAESDETDLGLRTASALWRFWQMRAADVEGREHLDRLLARRPGSPAVRAYAQSRAAGLAYYQGDFDAVHRYVEASMPVHRELGDDWNLACCLQVLTLSSIAEGDLDQARALADETLELSRRERNPTSEAYALANLGVVLGVQGQLDDAQRVVEDSVRRARELGNLRSVGSWTKALGGITFLQGNYPRARELFEQSLAIFRNLDDAWGTLGTLSGLALVALEEHDNGSARRLLHENLALLKKSGHQYRAAKALEIAARLAAANGRHRRAVRLYGAANVVRGSASAVMFECEVWPDPAPHVAQVRDVLGETAFAEAWAQGEAMTHGDALEYAFDDGDA
jgi:predicted ATPase/DNA-binding SARP family transcriptional activator